MQLEFSSPIPCPFPLRREGVLMRKVPPSLWECPSPTVGRPGGAGDGELNFATNLPIPLDPSCIICCDLP